MHAFETAAVLDDASHLTLREPVPGASGRECRVIMLFEPGEPGTAAAWPPGIFDEIRVTDPAFARPAQGEVPPSRALDQA